MAKYKYGDRVKFVIFHVIHETTLLACYSNGAFFPLDQVIPELNEQELEAVKECEDEDCFGFMPYEVIIDQTGQS